MTLFNMPGHLIRRLNQLSGTTFQKHLQEAGYNLTSVQFAAMSTLKASPGLEQAQIAALIAYDRATIGGVIDRLEQKGYVSRTVSKKDRRARECQLTEEGLRVIGEVAPVVEALQREILHNLDDGEYEQFIALAQKAIGQE